MSSTLQPMTIQGVTVRRYEDGDLPTLQQLFRETVHTVAQRNYTQAQLDAWAPAEMNQARWQQMIATEEFAIAETGSQVIVGFCSWDATGYIDMLFVHHEHQRRGIATLLYQTMESAMSARGITRLHTQASITAQPFFTQQGFRIVKAQKVLTRGVEIPNAIMEKRLV